MSAEPSTAVRLYGTEEAVPAPRILKAGPLTAELEAGNLRYVRYGGVELLRAISFIVRDRNWGTYNPEIEDLVVEEEGGSFRVRYRATAADAGQRLEYVAEIEGRSDGHLVFRGTGKAVSDFVTNRTGFVVLHPGEVVAGKPVEIEHVDGGHEKATFPEIIDPVQPMMDLRALTHEAAPGLSVTCRMEGDTYEMEDQRNWTDASYKTYVRPLALPWPYTLGAGSTIEQSVTLEVEGSPPSRQSAGGGIELALEEMAGDMPVLGAGLDPDDADGALSEADTLRNLDLDHVLCRFDPRRGHDRETLRKGLDLARKIGASAWLEAVVSSVDGFSAEIEELGRTMADLDGTFDTVLVSPAPDLKCTLPGSPWPPCPPLADVYEAARRAFPDARLGGGMFSYFTELNRKRPPLDQLDLVSFTTSAIVHAGDDRSVMEGLGALPFIARSAAAIAGGKPVAVGPSAIGMRDNPYGEKPMANPGNIRQAMNYNDPRQRGLLGAAWNLAYFGHFAEGGAGAVTLGGLAGPFGTVHRPMPWPQPWYDEAGGLFPVFHVLRGLAGLKGAKRVRLRNSAPYRLQAVAGRTDEGTEVWLANLTPEEIEVTLAGCAVNESSMLDAGSFVAASRSADFMDRMNEDGDGGPVKLPAFAVMRLRLA